MVVIKLLALALFIAVGATHLHPANYHPFAPNGFTGIHQGAAIVFFAYIGFDAISTAAEETKNPQRNLPIGILGGLAICTLIYVIVGRRADRDGAVQGAGGRRSARARAAARRLQHGRLDRRARRDGLDVGGAAGVPVRSAAHLLRDGARRPAPAMGRAHSPADEDSVRSTTLFTGVFVAAWSLIGDAGETYDLTNIGTLFAFMLVSIGVLVLRYTEPRRPRPFRVPFVWPVTLLSAAACLFIMNGLPRQAWERFGIWLVIGLVSVLPLRIPTQPAAHRPHVARSPAVVISERRDRQTRRASRRPDLAGARRSRFTPCCSLTLLAWSWRKWPDPIIDFGRELYVSVADYRGRVLYRDLASLFGPLSPYVNAIWFRLFGVSLTTLVVCNRRDLRAASCRRFIDSSGLCADRTSAAVASLSVLLLFGFSQLRRDRQLQLRDAVRARGDPRPGDRDCAPALSGDRSADRPPMELGRGWILLRADRVDQAGNLDCGDRRGRGRGHRADAARPQRSSRDRAGDAALRWLRGRPAGMLLRLLSLADARGRRVARHGGRVGVRRAEAGSSAARSTAMAWGSIGRSATWCGCSRRLPDSRYSSRPRRSSRGRTTGSRSRSILRRVQQVTLLVAAIGLAQTGLVFVALPLIVMSVLVASGALFMRATRARPTEAVALRFLMTRNMVGLCARVAGEDGFEPAHRAVRLLPRPPGGRLDGDC